MLHPAYPLRSAFAQDKRIAIMLKAKRTGWNVRNNVTRNNHSMMRDVQILAVQILADHRRAERVQSLCSDQSVSDP
jgi:hypothetical protein